MARRLFLGIMLVTLALSGCDDFDFYTTLDGVPPIDLDDPPDGGVFPLAMAITEATIAIGSTYTFSASGGVPPYTFSVTDGSGTIDAETGAYTAPDNTGVDTVRVTDAVEAISECTVTVVEQVRFTISPTTITLAANASTTFTASGGVPPYAYAVTEGSGAIDAATGEYTAPAAEDVDTVEATDDLGNTSTATVTIVSSLGFFISPLAITLTVNNSVVFSAFGGSLPYTFSLVSGGGSIDTGTGAYTAGPEPGTDVVRVEDGAGNTSDATVTVYAIFVVSPSSVTLTVNSTFAFTASGGLAPYTFSLLSGTGSVDSETGEYAAPADPDSGVIQVQDALGNTVTAVVIVTAPAPLVISPTSLTINVDDSSTFTATGGRSPYLYSLVAPVFGSIDESSGVYTAPVAANTDTVRVTDALATTSDATVVVVAGGDLTIYPESVVVEQTQTVTFTATGGTPGYTYSVTSGAGTGAINTSTGVYIAPDLLVASTVRVTDSLSLWVETDVTIAPLAPSGLDADGAAGGPQYVLLTWIDNATGEDGYSVERGDGTEEGYVEIGTVEGDITLYEDDGLNPSGLYFYRVRAYAGAVYSGYSNSDWAIPNP